ncbi:hypothetical protein V8G54_017347, partial [Vigna mungo]
VLAVCDSEIIVGIGALINTVWRGCSSDSKNGCWAFCPLSLTDLRHSHHLRLVCFEVDGDGIWRGSDSTGWIRRAFCLVSEVVFDDDGRSVCVLYVCKSGSVMGRCTCIISNCHLTL